VENFVELTKLSYVKTNQNNPRMHALHNFIRESSLRDEDFEMCDQDENFVPMQSSSSSQPSGAYNHLGDEDGNMNTFRDQLANDLFAMRE
jgi:hypothetical protein